MSDSIKLNTFPSNKIQALTLLYLNSQEVKELTPEGLVDLYNEVYERISSRFGEKTSGWLK